MTPLPGALGGLALRAWRLELTRHASTWASAEGAFRFGGRWSSAGRRVLYTAIDPATAIVEIGVHKGLHTLDSVPHTLLDISINDPSGVHVMDGGTIPNPNWLCPGTVGRGQQMFGDALLTTYPLVLVPSVVSTHSWNLLIDVLGGDGLFRLRHSEAFALDPRLNLIHCA